MKKDNAIVLIVLMILVYSVIVSFLPSDDGRVITPLFTRIITPCPEDRLFLCVPTPTRISTQVVK
mgnify:FL=1